MIFRFNKAQLSNEMRESLDDVLAKLQESNQAEIDVSVVEFPKSFKVKLDEDVELIVCWSVVDSCYAPMTEPEPTPEPTPESQSQGFLICCLDIDGKVIKSGLEPDIDPIELARLKYELMSTHLNMPAEKKIIFAKEYARLWSEHR